MAKRLRRFPWEALDSLTREQLEAAARVRGQLLPALDPALVARTASELLGAPVEIQVRGVARGDALPPELGARVFLGARGDLSAELVVDLEASLAVRLASAVVRAPPPLFSPPGRPDPEIRGAAAALLVVLARRSGAGAPYRLTAPLAAAPLLVVSVVVLVQDDIFEATVSVPISPALLPRPLFDRARLLSLGALPIGLPLVAAETWLARAELAALLPGAALAPGEGWSLRRGPGGFSGRAALAAGGSERGLDVALLQQPGGLLSLVLGPDPLTLPWDTNGTPPPEGPEDLADGPVVLRVEVATVTLAARAWAELTPGDVVATGVRLGEPVTLRAGGTAFARGELCDLEGELAVRIVERHAAAPPDRPPVGDGT